MENEMKYIIPTIIFTIILLGCSKEEAEDDTTTNSLTCTGTSSGNGAAIGSLTLEEATYLSTCFSSKKVKFVFKNNTSAQYTMFGYGDSSCTGTATSESSACLESISVSSTAVTKPTYVDGIIGDNATWYTTTGTWKHDESTSYMEFSGVSSAAFWYDQSSSQAGLDSNTVWIFKLTKQ